MRSIAMVIFTIWILLVMNTFAHGAEIGIVTTTGNPTCEQAQKDLDTVRSRYDQIMTLKSVMTDSSMQLTLEAELRGLAKLGGTIMMWQNEHCKKS